MVAFPNKPMGLPTKNDQPLACEMGKPTIYGNTHMTPIQRGFCFKCSDIPVFSAWLSSSQATRPLGCYKLTSPKSSSDGCDFVFFLPPNTHRIHGTRIFTYIYHKSKPNVGKYTIHGSYGIWKICANQRWDLNDNDLILQNTIRVNEETSDNESLKPPPFFWTCGRDQFLMASQVFHPP